MKRRRFSIIIVLLIALAIFGIGWGVGIITSNHTTLDNINHNVNDILHLLRY